MIKKFIIFLSCLIILIDNIIFFFFKKNFRYHLYNFLRINSVTKILIKKKNVLLFNPSHLSKWRVKTFFTKEPETLQWIESFKKNSKIIFWDIGANIGLYSIHAAINFPKSTIISFEPSTSNLNILSRNISLNDLEKQINIFQIGLTNINNKFFIMSETTLEEGGALSSFGKNYNFEGKKIDKINKYSIFGTKIDYLIFNNILKIPDYIKIDVDGTEHIILKGAEKTLKKNKIKSILVEVNENFLSQKVHVEKILKNCGFYLKHKYLAQDVIGTKFSKSYNYIFYRKI
jgi:FkbM family methyltransferase